MGGYLNQGHSILELIMYKLQFIDEIIWCKSLTNFGCYCFEIFERGNVL